MRKSAYFISLIRVENTLDPNCKYFKVRTIGFFNSLKDAIWIAENNKVDALNEGNYYNYLIIEEINEGLYSNQLISMDKVNRIIFRGRKNRWKKYNKVPKEIIGCMKFEGQYVTGNISEVG